MEDLREMLARAAAELGIDVPVCAYERIPGGGLKLWLYGRGDKPVTWMPSEAEPRPKGKKVKHESKT